MSDPLAGLREGLNRREIKMLVFNQDVCPVAPGDRFTLRSCVIEIESCNRKLVKGRWVWHAAFIRHEEDRPQLLRRVPSGMPTPSDQIAGRSDIERARIESAYTSSPRQAIVDEPESVGPDWVDPGVEERRKVRLEALREERAEELAREQVRKLKARLDQVAVPLGRKGKDLTAELQPIYDRLNEMEEAA